MSKMIDDVFCPALGRKIEIGYCLEFQLAADGAITTEQMPDEITPNARRICKNCPKRDDPAAD